MRHHWVDTVAQVRLAVAITVTIALLSPTRAAEPDLDRFRANVDAFVGRLGPSSNGVVRWAGSDPYEIRREGDTLVAVIANPRLSFRDERVGHLSLDRIEIRQIGQKDDGRLIELAVLLPRVAMLSEADGAKTKIELKDGTANALIEEGSGRGRETTVKIATVRIDQPKKGAWVSVGPLSMASKLVAGPNGGWSGPIDLEANEIEFVIPEGPLGGEIHRIAFSGDSSGPRLDELNKLRDALEALQSDDGRSPEARSTALMRILPMIADPFGKIHGKLALDGLIVRSVTGERLVSLAQAESTMEVAGLDTEEASIHFGVRHEGLDVAPSLLDKTKVPRRAVIDLGVGNLSMQALSKVIRAITTMAAVDDAGEHGDQEGKQQATQQILGAVAMLNPTFHIYDCAVDTLEVGIDLTAEARGSPLAPKGYTAAGELAVRGFDEIASLGVGIPFTEYLPVLKELGVDERAQDGTPRLEFNLASAPPKWITINGNDVSGWFGGSEPQKGQPRRLKPSDPPLEGEDVKNVQRALARLNFAVEQNGVYDSSTAAAVARFQKQNGMNVDGVVDPATRRQLGVTEVAPQGGRN
jgi:Putative peptidoglycan binding domain